MAQRLNELISEGALDFALRHISQYYDTDFFPRAEEFLAIRYSWDEVKEWILGSTIDSILSAPPLVEPWPKTTSGFRIVHRPEPIDSVVYAALAKVIAPHVEKGRASPEVACSYRLSESDTSFFAGGSGFNVYRERCEKLSNTHPFVLLADISDFYNRIYLHRLQNAIQTVTDQPPGISNRIEHFLGVLNTKASQGIPVGPAASIIMAEACLIDADQFFFERGFDHVRYVDDFRIFGDSEQELRGLLQDFCVYLHENQRLSLSPQKTKICPSEEFVKRELNNQYQLEKLEILGEIEVVNPYTLKVEEVGVGIVENAGEILSDALNRITKYETLDLGVIRAIVRRARSNDIKDIAPILLDHIEFFAPAVNDIALYLDAITDDEFSKEYSDTFAGLCGHPAMEFRSVRLWFEWYFSRHAGLVANADIRAFIFSGHRFRPKACASITLKSQSWVKKQKNQLLHHVHWDRRSILIASQVLSKDEREKWLKPLLKGDAISQMDRWMIAWVLAGSPNENEISKKIVAEDFDDGLPF